MRLRPMRPISCRTRAISSWPCRSAPATISVSVPTVGSSPSQTSRRRRYRRPSTPSRRSSRRSIRRTSIWSSTSRPTRCRRPDMDESIRKMFDPAHLPARGELGDVAHPDLQRFNVERDDELYVDTAALVAAGWEYRTVTLDSSNDPAANDRYFEEGDPDFSAW